ncbi:hypothetical protein ILUMI_17716 [Ignelater luminosus]|uniref:HTH CENPB-type domain-containing protein n=1 Tax=Ignelater luminosus TaxID=2038154 RepID=A0A8K0CQI8_IGNLU|nr:hypothetical protein ILUMI_17716 [Ignelater luminosus]
MLATYIKDCPKTQFGLTYQQIRQFAHSYALRLNHRVPNNWVLSNAVGLDWMKGFIKRHPDLSLRKPEPTSLVRTISFNMYNINMFFHNLGRIQLRYNFTSDKIINVDESGVSTVLAVPKIVAPKEYKQVGQTVSGETGEQVTFVGIVTASGEAFPPVYIFPRARYKEEFLNGAPPGSIVLTIPSGWMTKEGFLERSWNRTPYLTPHCIHRLQPLDISIFGPFKSKCKVAFNNWLANNPSKTITIKQIAALTAEAFTTFNTQNTTAGFKKAGIFPMNQNIFSQNDFFSCKVTDILQKDDDGIARSQDSVQEDLNKIEDSTEATDLPSTSSLAVQITPEMDETSDEDEIDEKQLCQESGESDVDFDVEDEDSEIKVGDFIIVKFATK